MLLPALYKITPFLCFRLIIWKAWAYFGTWHFRRRHFGTAFSARGYFGTRTFWHGYFLALRMFLHGNVMALKHSRTRVFRHMDMLCKVTKCTCAETSMCQNILVPKSPHDEMSVPKCFLPKWNFKKRTIKLCNPY